MLRKIIYGLLILLSTISCGAQADILTLHQGDTLSGKVVRIAEGTLVFRTALSGQMMVPMDTVEGLRTDSNLVISMNDDSVQYGKFIRHNEAAHILPLNSNTPIPLNLAQVQEAMVLPSTPEEKKTWEKRLSTGLQGRISNEDALHAYTRLELSRRATTGPELDINLKTDLSDEGSFPSNFDASFDLRSGKRNELRPYMSLTLTKDEQRALNLESNLSLGLGKYWLDNDTHELYGGLGLNATRKNRDGDYHNSQASDHNNTDLHLELQLRYQGWITQNTTLQNTLILLPGISDLDAFQASSNTTITYPITHRLKLRFDLDLQYDNQPTYHNLNRWNAGVGAGVQFDF